MRRLPFLHVGIALVGALFGAGCASHPKLAATGQQPGRFTTTLTRQVGLDYLLFLPQDYRASGETRWPLIVFLHGAGERGTNVQLVAVHGPPKIVRQDASFPFIVLSPQCPEGSSWNVETLNALLDETIARHAIDPKRVYLTGLSMGGYGSWAWASANPERFAAVVPICGGGDPMPVRLSSGARRERLARLPVWAFHGAKDTVVTLTESQRMVDTYQMIGNSARLTVYPEAGHDSWTDTYGNPALYEWLRQQALP
jgi:predicted peptidase